MGETVAELRRTKDFGDELELEAGEPKHRLLTIDGSNGHD
jgi:hypothetical protein